MSGGSRRREQRQRRRLAENIPCRRPEQTPRTDFALAMAEGHWRLRRPEQITKVTEEAFNAALSAFQPPSAETFAYVPLQFDSPALF